ncbi:MAG: metallophosphoesterase [Treponemataceae bacterium]
MKILCVSDQIDPLVYSNSAKERFKDIDLILCAGDLPMEYVDFIVSTLNKPTYFIFGNHNLSEFKYYHRVESGISNADLSACHGATYAGFKVLKANKLLIAGVSGSIAYNNGLNQYSDKKMLSLLVKMIPRLIYNKIRYKRFVDIFLTHAPPLGIHDRNDPCHRGFKCYLWFLQKFKPKYMIHGHIHLYDAQDIRVSKFEETTIINAYSHYILNFDEIKEG